MKKKSSSKIRESVGLFLVYSWFIFEINHISLKSFGHRPGLDPIGARFNTVQVMLKKNQDEMRFQKFAFI